MVKGKDHMDILEYCKTLHLDAIAENFSELETEANDYGEYLRSLLYLQVERTEQRRLETRIRTARFPSKAYLEDLELDCLPAGMRQRLPELGTLEFVRNGQNLILTGNAGTGKTHTATGLGIRACEQGYSVLFTTVPHLVTELRECDGTKTLRAFERKFTKYDLVILDELGYVSFDREGADLLFANLSLRAAHKSTIITSNLPFDWWVEVFGDPAITSAIVDRLTYKAILVDMMGESYRYRETLRSGGLLPDGIPCK